jgi:CSLREA domain-containing protein
MLIIAPVASMSFFAVYKVSATSSALSPAVLPALSLTVNTPGDAADVTLDGNCDSNTGMAGSQCTLRAAIQEANNAAGADTIGFDPALNGSTITLNSSLLANGDLAINGPGANLLTVQRSTAGGTSEFPVFQTSGNITIFGLTISNGFYEGIHNSFGTLLVSSCSIVGNNGDGVSQTTQGTLTVNNSIVSNNMGHGVKNQTAFTVTATINNSTISNNLYSGIYNFVDESGGHATLTVNNSTVSGNNMSGTNFAGGIQSRAIRAGTASATINNSTISGNGAVGISVSASNNMGTGANSTATLNNSTVSDNNGGMVSSSFNSATITLILRNTIVAGNFHNTDETVSDISGPVDPASSFSLIGDGTGMTGVSHGSNGNQVGTSVAPINPRLGPLADNGGPTQTRALIAGSPALDAGDNTNATNAGLTNDQRGVGFSRIVDGPDADATATVDIGAFEAQVWLQDIVDRSMIQDSSDSFSFNVGGAAAITSVTATSSNASLVPNNSSNLNVTGAGSSRTLTINPAAGQSGTSTITVTVNSDSGSMSDTFILIVNFINNPPSFLKGSNQTAAEDSGAQVVSGWATAISPGPPVESGQTVTFLVQGNTNPSLFAAGPAISPTGTLTYTAAANAIGTATITIALKDNGGGADTSPSQTFAITITEVNDAPAAVGDTLSDVPEDSGPRTILASTLMANDSSGPANESSQNLIINAVSDAEGGTVAIVAGDVVFTPTANYNGPASFQYRVEDNGTTSGATDPKNSGPAFVQFNITQINDAPTAANDTLTNVAEDSGQRTISGSSLTTNDSKGPANESGQTLTVKTVSNAVGGTVSIGGGNVLFTPAADFNGPASFQYTVEDDGTTNGVADPKTSTAATASFNISEVADTPSVTGAATNANTQTTSGLVISRNPADGAGVTHFKITGITGGTLFKNNGITLINNGDFITFAEGNAGLKFTPGTSNGSFVVQASTSASDAGLGGGTALASININPLGGVLRFSSENYSVAEGGGFKAITVERSGDTSRAVTVDYASSDHSNPADFLPCTSPGVGFASSRCDFTTAIGTLRFAAGETSKTFNVLTSQDNYVEGPESLSLTLSNPTGGAVFGVPQTSTLSITGDATEPASNPIDTSSEFVRSQYHDFLNREPDAPGLAFWTDNIEKCNDPARRPVGQTAAQCIDKQRESTAVAFFSSPEFQMTGGFVYRLYKGSLTGLPNYDGGSAGRFPTSLEFMRDVSQVSEGIVVNNQISGAVVEANRNRLTEEFVLRPEFVAKYGGLNNTLYVLELFNTTGIAATTAEKQTLIDALTNRVETRASVLRKVVDGTVVLSESNVQFTTTYGEAFYNQENRRVFVYMEYAGYLRRNPDQAGFVFWLGKLNTYNGDPFAAEMVRAFILSPEYRQRFGQP